MKNLLLIIVLLFGLLAFFPIISSANYYLGLNGTTWINITLSAYDVSNDVWNTVNVTGYLKDLALGEGVTEYHLQATSVSGTYTFTFNVFVRIANFSNNYDVIAEYLSNTTTSYASYAANITVQIKPVLLSQPKITVFPNSNALINASYTVNPSFQNNTWVDTTNDDVITSKQNITLLGGFSYTAYYNNSYPKLIIDLNPLPDNTTTTTNPPTPYDIYFFDNNGNVVYYTKDNKNWFPTSKMLGYNVSNPVLFEPTNYRSLLDNYYVEVYYYGAIYPRTYSLKNVLDSQKYSYPLKTAYIVIQSDVPATYRVTSVVNGLVVDETMNKTTSRVFVANDKTFYIVTATNENGETKSVSFTASDGQTVFINFATNKVNFVWGGLNKTFTPARNLTKPNTTLPILDLSGIDPIIPLVIVYMSVLLVMVVFPSTIAWIGGVLAVGIIYFARYQGWINLSDNALAVFFILPVAIMLFAGRGR